MPLLEILSFLLFACSALCFASALQTWSLRQAPRAKTISLLLASCAVWALCATQELHAPLLFQPFWSSLSYLGAAWVGPLLFLGTQTPSPTRPWWLRPGLHTIFPLFTWITVASNPWTGFFYSSFSQVPAEAPLITLYGHGWAFWVFLLSTYAYSLIACATVLLRIRSQPVHPRAAIIWVVAICPPWIASIVYVTGLSPTPGLDWTPVAFACSSLLLSIAMRQFSFVDPSPFARTSLIEHLQDGVLVFDRNGLLRDSNAAATALLGVPLVPGTTFAKGLPEHFAATAGNHHALIGSRDLEIRSLLLGASESPVGSLHILHDVTERMQNEARIRLLSQAVEAGPTAMLVTDLQGTIVYVNKRFCLISGYSEDEVLGQNPRLLNSGTHPRDFFKGMWEKLLAGQVWRGEIRNKRKNGTTYWHRADIAPLRSAQGEITHFVALTEDVTERKAMQERLEQMASTDALTGLYNRRFILQIGQKEFGKHRRNQHQLSLAMLDIDHFKSINDLYGHSTGDRALKLFAELLHKAFREGDLIGRFGGEEFLLIFPDTDSQRAVQACDRLRELLKQTPLTTPQGPIFFTISAGVATLNTDATLEMLIQRSDQALYNAKNSGRDCSRLA